MKSFVFGLLTKGKQHFLLSILLIVSILFGAPIYAQQVENKTINPEFIVKEINRTGKLAFKRAVNLSFKTSGFLKTLDIDEGERFSKGQILAQLDTAELVAEKNANYARLSQAKREVNRIKTLLSKKLSSQQALDDAKTLVATTRASHQVAEYNLSRSQLIAPFDGVVLTRFSELGELQSPNQSVLQLAALDNNLVVRVSLPATEVNSINLQQKIDINLSAFGNTTGTVSKIPAIANQHSHLFSIEILLTDLTVTQVAVGQLARISTTIMTNQLAYRLPIGALNSVDKQGRALIMLKQAGSSDLDNFHQQAFTIKQLSNEYIYLSAEADDLPITVITQGWQQLALSKVKLENEAK